MNLHVLKTAPVSVMCSDVTDGQTVPTTRMRRDARLIPRTCALNRASTGAPTTSVSTVAVCVMEAMTVATAQMNLSFVVSLNKILSW